MLLGIIKQFTEHKSSHLQCTTEFTIPIVWPLLHLVIHLISDVNVWFTKQNRDIQTGSVVASDNDYCPGAYGQLMELPDSCMSRMSVSMGVFPTRRMKKSWEMRLAGTALRAGSRSRSRPKRWGCPGYCMRSYSVRATWAFSCRLSTWAGSVSPHASKNKHEQQQILGFKLDFV